MSKSMKETLGINFYFDIQKKTETRQMRHSSMFSVIKNIKE